MSAATKPNLKFKFLKRASELQPKPLRALIYGAPGVGKTTMLATLPRPLVVIDFEGGAAVRLSGENDIYIAEAHSYNDLLQILNEIDAVSGIKSIAFDGFSVFVESLLEELVIQAKREAPTFREWNRLSNLVKRIVFRLRKPNQHLVFTAFEKVLRHPGTPGEPEIVEVFPKLPREIRLYLLGLVDIAGRLFKNGEGNVLVDFAGKSADLVEVKDRTGKLGIEAPSFLRIIQKTFGDTKETTETTKNDNLDSLETFLLEEEEKKPEPVTQKQLAYIHKLVKDLGWSDEKYRDWLFTIYRRKSAKELTKYEAKLVIDALIEELEKKQKEEQK
jgi:phage nucleotide-binding protein